MDTVLGHLSPDEIALLGDTPAVEPPPGITSNFVNPPSLAPLARWTTSILLTVALFFYLNRMYIKARLMRGFTWDDGESVPSSYSNQQDLTRAATLSIAFIIGCAEYALNIWGCQMGLLGLHLWDIPLVRLISLDAQHFFYIILVIQPVMLLFLKVTFFILYLNMFYNIRWARISSWIGLTFTIVAHCALAVTSFAVARPNYSPAYNKYTSPIGIALGTIGLAIDLAIFVIPYIVVAGLQLSRAKKIGAYVMFMTGICAIICSVFNIYLRGKMEHSTDALWDEIRPAVAALSEIFLGISCACIPSLAYGIRHTGSIYQKLLRRKTLSGSPAPSAPTSGAKSQKKDVEMGSITSRSHINTTVEEQELELHEFHAS